MAACSVGGVASSETQSGMEGLPLGKARRPSRAEHRLDLKRSQAVAPRALAEKFGAPCHGES